MKRDTQARVLGIITLLTLPLFTAAQSLDVSQLQELDDDNAEITYQGISIDQLEDMDVVRDGEVIGEVEEVLGDANGEVVALAIEYGGNALGIGDREVVVAIEEVELSAEENTLEISLSDDELDGMIAWTD